jgi:hypothetical protein
MPRTVQEETMTLIARWTGPARIVHDDQGAYFEINLD